MTMSERNDHGQKAEISKQTGMILQKQQSKFQQ